MVLAADVDLKQVSVKSMTNPQEFGCSGRSSLSLHGPTRILLLKRSAISETKRKVIFNK